MGDGNKKGHGVVLVFGSTELSPEEVQALGRRFTEYAKRYDPSMEVIATAQSVEVGHNGSLVESIRRSLLSSRKIPAVSDVLEIDWAGRRIFYAGYEVLLSPNEHKLMHFLFDRGGQVVPQEEINAHFRFVGVSPDSLRSLMRRLRKKLGPFSSHLFTQPGIGYGFRLGDNIITINDERTSHHVARHAPLLQLPAVDGGADRDVRRRA